MGPRSMHSPQWGLGRLGSSKEEEEHNKAHGEALGRGGVLRGLRLELEDGYRHVQTMQLLFVVFARVHFLKGAFC